MLLTLPTPGPLKETEESMFKLIIVSPICKPIKTPKLADRKPLGLNEDREVSLAEAIWHVKSADYVAVGVTLNDCNSQCVVDVSKATLLKALRCLKRVNRTRPKSKRVYAVRVSDVFGTTVVG